VRSVCVNPKAPAMDRIYEDRPVLDMTRHNEAETAEIRRWADDQQMTTIRAGLSAATAQSPLADFTMTDDAQRTWDDLNIGRKREVLRTLLTVMLPPLGRGHTFNRDLIQIRPCAPTGPAAAD
jgi:site-specific DNA recombinase